MPRLLSALYLLTCAVLTPAWAHGELPPNLQLGSIALDAEGRGFAVAVPLDSPRHHVRLIDAPSPLSLEEWKGSTWLVAEPTSQGPFSAMLEWKDANGRTQRTVVAGEVVDADPSLLLVSKRGELRRALRMINLPPAYRLELTGGRAEISEPNVDGWQTVSIAPGPGQSELRGSLVLADDTSIPTQVSAAEVVSVLGSVSLGTSVRWMDVIPLRERLGFQELRARIALRGNFQGQRVLSLADMVSTPNGVRFSGLGNLFVPAPPAGLPSRALGLRLPEPAMMYLAGRDARLLDLRQGIVDLESFTEFRFERAVVSPLDPSSVLAVRRNEDGKYQLGRWSVREVGGSPRLQARRLGPPLREVFGLRDLVVHDLRARKLHGAFPQASVRERLMLLASPRQSGVETLQPRILGVRLDARQTGILDARVLWKSGPTIPIGGAGPRMSVLPSMLKGDEGYPVGARVNYPSLRSGRRLIRVRPGERFQARYNVGQRSSRFRSLGVLLSPRRHLGVDTDGTNTFLRRFEQGVQEPTLGAQGTLQGVRPMQLRASQLRSRAYLMTEGPNGRRLRLLDIGLPLGTNLPPQVDAGPDVRVRASSRTGARVLLNARLRDVNGDPLGIRWEGAGVRFQNPTSARTRAILPVGVTQLRARVRERAFKAASYEAVDVRTITVESVTAVPPSPGLATRLVSIAPNPANPRVRVSFTLAKSGPARVRILDARGRLVRELLDERRVVGAHELVWDGVDDSGKNAASGVYFVELQAEGTLDTGRLALVR